MLEPRPAWHREGVAALPREAAATDAQLFSMSDEPLMRFTRFYRFEAD